LPVYLLSWTHLHITLVDGFSRLMAQTTLTRAGCAFWDDIAAHFGGEILHQPPIFWAWIGVFNPNEQNVKSFILSKLRHRFQLNFAQRMIETTTLSSTNVRPRNPRWRSAAIWKTLNCHISVTVRPILMKPNEMWHDDAHWPPTADRPLKFRIFENPRWRRPPSWKSQNSRYLNNGLTNLHEIWYDGAEWVS